MNNRLILGVDTGGTFTDFVLFDGRQIKTHKRLSTPHAPEEAILKGIEDLGLTSKGLTVIHGSTVATNAALEGKGVRTVFITNRGMGDMLTIGRQARQALYDLQPPARTPPVPAELCLETGGRIGADGSLLEPLTDDDLHQLTRQLKQLQPAAVAINLLFSFIDDRAERAIEAAVPEGIFVSRSSEILPEYREYERGITTWLNAWVGPLVEAYLARLGRGLPESLITVMQSSGGTIAADRAGRQAVHMLLSGPAGGLAAARFVGRLGGREQLLTFDMGGTSTDVALIDGELRLTNEGRIGPYPVAVPMVDMHTIGAGGGSIAYLDSGGMLQVGPESAGAAPGPACYGQGGTRPTVTDANLVLGRLRPDAFLGGRMRLDPEAARQAVASVAIPLGLTVEETAAGIISLANEHMAQALRVISVERGINPAGFTLTPFGGAGGLHVCALARALEIRRIMVPVHGGVLSALGMLVAPRSRELSRTIARPAAGYPEQRLQEQFQSLEGRAREALISEGADPDTIIHRYALDLRYQGQSFSLTIPWQGLEQSLVQFHEAHEQRYGHRLQQAVEITNIRVHAESPPAEIRLPSLAKQASAPAGAAKLHGLEQPATLWNRTGLSPGQRLAGPALITETVATTYIEPGWQCEVDPYGNLMLSLDQD